MFRAIKTVDRVDDGGASVSIRRQIDLATRNPDKTNGKLLSHVGRNCNPRGHFVLSKIIIPIFHFALLIVEIVDDSLCSRKITRKLSFAGKSESIDHRGVDFETIGNRLLEIERRKLWR